jgi:hypothetical protein
MSERRGKGSRKAHSILKIRREDQPLPSMEIIHRFIEMCPELQKRWDDHLEYWGKEDRGDYIDISVVAHFIVDSLKEGLTENYDKIFSLIEEKLNEGNSKEQEILSVGLLEDIQNIASHTAQGYKPFERWLGPTSLKVWVGIEKAWEGKSSLMDVIREENKQKRNG